MACILVTSQSINYTCVARKLIYGLPSDLHFRSLTAVLTAECPEKTGKRPPGSVALNTHGGIPALKKWLCLKIPGTPKNNCESSFSSLQYIGNKAGAYPIAKQIPALEEFISINPRSEISHGRMAIFREAKWPNLRPRSNLWRQVPILFISII